ncbi:NIPSNAP family protein [Actimicrobium antarcticum]|uniref:NIPSNAP family protein n=1 Tax=Actimicrobium antarcticum TaxID=1051899 RepID=A0ABP7T806_9BURK
MRKFIEIRSYSIEPGTRNEFDLRLREQMLPLLAQRGIDVVACRASLHDETSYYLIRAYDSLAHRAQSQESMFDHPEWKEGPREAILSLVDSYTSVVIEMDEVTIQALRQDA